MVVNRRDIVKPKGKTNSAAKMLKNAAYGVTVGFVKDIMGGPKSKPKINRPNKTRPKRK